MLVPQAWFCGLVLRPQCGTAFGCRAAPRTVPQVAPQTRPGARSQTTRIQASAPTCDQTDTRPRALGVDGSCGTRILFSCATHWVSTQSVHSSAESQGRIPAEI